MVSDVIALPSDSFSGLNQVSDCLGFLRRPPQTHGNKFTPSFFILPLVNMHVVSCCPLSKPLFKKMFLRHFKCKAKQLYVSDVSDVQVGSLFFFFFCTFRSKIAFILMFSGALGQR